MTTVYIGSQETKKLYQAYPYPKKMKSKLIASVTLEGCSREIITTAV